METGSETLTETQVAQDWKEGIQTEYHKAIEGFSDNNGLAKGYSELFTKLGSYAKLPTEETPAEERSAFYKKCGAPETPEGYTMPELPEGKEYDKEFVGSMQFASQKAGVTNAQFMEQVNAFLAWEGQREELAKGEKVRVAAEGDRVLRERWGAEYAANSSIVQRACDELITDEKGEPDVELHDAFAALIEEKDLKDNPIFARVFCGIGQKTLSDTFVKGEGATEGEDKDYKPANDNSPGMYADGDDDDSKKARNWFRVNKNYVYSRDD